MDWFASIAAPKAQTAEAQLVVGTLTADLSVPYTSERTHGVSAVVIPAAAAASAAQHLSALQQYISAIRLVSIVLLSLQLPQAKDFRLEPTLTGDR
jgi:hypothetical protein